MERANERGEDYRKRRSVGVVLNGAAGALLDRPDMLEALVRSFRRAGFDPDFVPPEAGTLSQRIERACKPSNDLVVVGGGDGTIACAAGIALGAGVALGILPFGTMNLLAKDLGVPVGDLDAAIDIVATGRERLIDVGSVNGHVFLCGSMLGLPARLARYRESGRGGRSWMRLWSRFGIAALRAFARGRSLNLILDRDGIAEPLRAAALNITVNPLDDPSGRLFGRSRLDGGELAIYAIKRLAFRDVLRFMLRVALGRWRADPELQESKARILTIFRQSRVVRVMNDGEVVLLKSPLRYHIRPRALRVIAP